MIQLKIGSFDPMELVGKPFGLTFEIQSDKSLHVLSAKDLILDDQGNI